MASLQGDSTSAKGHRFEQEVGEHYRSLGYEVKWNVPVAGQQVDLVATMRLPAGQPHIVMVECKYHEVGDAGNADVQSIAAAFQIARTQGLAQACTIVTTHGFSQPAQLVAAAAGLNLLTIDQLKRFSWRVPARLAAGLSKQYEARVRDSKATRTSILIKGHGRRVDDASQIDDFAGYLWQHATSPHTGTLIVFGGVGSGKTTQLLSLAHSLITDYLAGGPAPAAIYLPMERFTRHRDAEYLDHFMVSYFRSQFPYPDLSWSDIVQWFADDRTVLILDGLDEIKHLRDVDDVREEYLHICEILRAAPRLILSCRSSLVPETPERFHAFRPPVHDTSHRTAQMAEILPFNDQEIREYLSAVDPSAFARYRPTGEIFRRPLFLRLLIALPPEAVARRSFDSDPDILEEAIGYLLQYKMNLRDVGIKLDEWRHFLEEAALGMMLTDTREVGVTDLAKFVQDYFGEQNGFDVLRKIRLNAQVRTVFDINAEGFGLRWAHPAFRDFLAGHAIARRLVAPDVADSLLDGTALTAEQLEFVRYGVRCRSGAARRLIDFRRPRARPQALSGSSGWCWISPGLGVVGGAGRPGGPKLAFFRKGFWLTRQPFSVADYLSLQAPPELRRSGQKDAFSLAVLNRITHDEATEIARAVGGRLPTEDEWERAARWIDATHPIEATLPAADERALRPPLAAGARANPWGIHNASGCVWQWTETWDRDSRSFICKGPWWGAAVAAKLDGSSRLFPREADHVRTGMRVACDPLHADGTL